MRIPGFFTVLTLALLGSACTERSLPVFLDPAPISIPAAKLAEGPRLSQGPDGKVIVSWMERDEDTARLRFAEYFDGDWQSATDVIADPAMFVNWADLPAVQSLGGERLLAFWLSQTADAPYAYQILFSQSADRGATWSEPASPHQDNTPTEHGFVSTYAASKGTGLVWLDGRETPDAAMTLRSAVISSDGETTLRALLDDNVCDCCQTDVAVTSDGPVAVYRNRSGAEVRDIYVTRFIDDQWQPGEAISADGWVISGCPVNGPAIDAADDFVAVAWFTGANGKPIVKTAMSRNAGKTFSEPSAISGKTPTGHVDVAIIDRHSYVVSWLESDRKGTYSIKIRGLTSDGQLGRAMTIGRTALARVVPQMVRAGDRLLFAWTDEIGGVRKIVSVYVPIAGFYD